MSRFIFYTKSIQSTPNIVFFLLVTILILSCSKEKDNGVKYINQEANSNLSWVNPFIGTGGHGHTYPGATVPFGMVQLSPDNGVSDWDWCSGYHYSDSLLIGFSHLHLTGTGIGDLNDIRFLPVGRKISLTKLAKNRDQLPYLAKYSHTNEKSEPGYYQVFLENDSINAELTASLRTGYHKYTFPKKGEKSLIIDLGFAFNWDKTLESYLEWEDQFTLSGYRYSTGWAKNQKVFFVAKFSKPVQLTEFYTNEKIQNTKSVKGERTSGQIYFDQTIDEIQISVALSSVSVENAKLNLEFDGNFDFEAVKKNAQNEWKKSLNEIEIQTKNDSLKTIFYTALYHSKLAPVVFNDKNGQFRFQNDSISKTEFPLYSTLSLWDTFRSENPLLTLLEPERSRDIVNSMLIYYNQSGILPVWTLYGNETNTMTGFHSVPVIAEAILKGVSGIDGENAYQALKATMMQDERSLKEYKRFGYIPFDLGNESVTSTLEYAYDDWCVAQVAKKFDKKEDYQYFLNRSKAYQKIFDSKTGFMRGKSSDGKTWRVPFDPKYSEHRINTDYTEGNAWQHSWFVLHEPKEFILLHGGNEIFLKRLEQLFTESSEITGDNVSADISGLIGQYAHGNEPSHHIAYLFNFAGQPWRTQFYIHEIIKTQYSAKPDGLSGNEDAGQMSAWLVFSSMGLYPFNPVSGKYEIGTPFFERTQINLPNGKSFVIQAKNVSDTNFYIQSAQLNGKNFNQTYLYHEQILEGGTLEFVMGNQPNKNWGIKN